MTAEDLAFSMPQGAGFIFLTVFQRPQYRDHSLRWMDVGFGINRFLGVGHTMSPQWRDRFRTLYDDAATPGIKS